MNFPKKILVWVSTFPMNLKSVLCKLKTNKLVFRKNKKKGLNIRALVETGNDSNPILLIINDLHFRDIFLLWPQAFTNYILILIY